jgi:hypothetical protein
MKGVARQVLALILILHARYGLSAPMNDAFEDRTALSGNHLTVRGTVSGASTETGDPEPSNWMVPWRGTKQTVWWTWTAGARGTLTVNASASVLYEKALVALKGETHSNLTLLSTALYDETLRFNVIADETYHIAVATDTIQDGDLLLFLDFTPSPPHDDLRIEPI